MKLESKKLIVNNVKGLGIHLIMTLFSILLVLIVVVLSPLYKAEFVAILVIGCLYISYIAFYLKLSSLLKVGGSPKQDYLIGGLAMIFGIGIWFATYYISGGLTRLSEGNEIYWIPYNAYIFPSWILLYGVKKPFLAIYS